MSKKLKVVPEESSIPATGQEERVPIHRGVGPNLPRYDLIQGAHSGSHRRRTVVMKLTGLCECQTNGRVTFLLLLPFVPIVPQASLYSADEVDPD